METPSSYSFSFITGALFHRESVALGMLLHRYNRWDEVVKVAKAENLLRQRTQASAVRMLREIGYRLGEFSADELAYFCATDFQEQNQLLFVAVCRRYRFIREFVLEVLSSKLDAFESKIFPGDFNRFFHEKALIASEVERLTDKSRAKVRQVLMRMLAEAGLIDSTSSQLLKRGSFSQKFASVLQAPERSLRFLLASEADNPHFLL